MKSIRIFPYWKNGDDFAHHLAKAPNAQVFVALENWGSELAEAAKQLQQIASIVAGHDITADGDTHWSVLHNVPDSIASLIVERYPSIAYIEEDTEEDCED
jgi:hypothetical protein